MQMRGLPWHEAGGQNSGGSCTSPYHMADEPAVPFTVIFSAHQRALNEGRSWLLAHYPFRHLVIGAWETASFRCSASHGWVIISCLLGSEKCREGSELPGNWLPLSALPPQKSYVRQPWMAGFGLHAAAFFGPRWWPALSLRMGLHGDLEWERRACSLGWGSMILWFCFFFQPNPSSLRVAWDTSIREAFQIGARKVKWSVGNCGMLGGKRQSRCSHKEPAVHRDIPVASSCFFLSFFLWCWGQNSGSCAC